jgi:hypothetical protein
MHGCPPPIEELKEWLEDHPSADGNFGHLLLLQKNADDGAHAKLCVGTLSPPHLDAREKSHGRSESISIKTPTVIRPQAAEERKPPRLSWI